jgi:hypothetical protein
MGAARRLLLLLVRWLLLPLLLLPLLLLVLCRWRPCGVPPVQQGRRGAAAG